MIRSPEGNTKPMPIDTTRTPSGSFQVARSMTQEEIDIAIGRRFRSLFGDGVTPEEIQRRMERAQELQHGSELTCQKLIQKKADEDPLALAVFIECLRNGTGRPESAIENTRRILLELEKAGGIRG